MGKVQVQTGSACHKLWLSYSPGPHTYRTRALCRKPLSSLALQHNCLGGESSLALQKRSKREREV